MSNAIYIIALDAGSGGASALRMPQPMTINVERGSELQKVLCCVHAFTLT